MNTDPSDRDEPGREAPTDAEKVDPDEMLLEYDFRGGERGKYAARYAEGTNVVLLDPDVAAVFPTAEAVNSALRAHAPDRQYPEAAAAPPQFVGFACR